MSSRTILAIKSNLHQELSRKQRIATFFYMLSKNTCDLSDVGDLIESRRL